MHQTAKLIGQTTPPTAKDCHWHRVRLHTTKLPASSFWILTCLGWLRLQCAGTDWAKPGVWDMTSVLDEGCHRDYDTILPPRNLRYDAFWPLTHSADMALYHAAMTITMSHVNQTDLHNCNQKAHASRTQENCTESWRILGQPKRGTDGKSWNMRPHDGE